MIDESLTQCLWCENPEDISVSEGWCYVCRRYSSTWNIENILTNHAHVFNYKLFPPSAPMCYAGRCVNPIRQELCTYQADPPPLKCIPIPEYESLLENTKMARWLHSAEFREQSREKYAKLVLERDEKKHQIEMQILQVYENLNL